MYEEEIHFGKLLLKQSETVLTHLTLVTQNQEGYPGPRTNVWTKFEEGRSRRSRVIDQKRKVTDRPNERWTE